MSTGEFTLSQTAAAQLAMMSMAEKNSLNAFFAADGSQAGSNTQRLESGGFVSRIGSKRVLWRPHTERKPEIVAIVDESYAGPFETRAAG